MLGEIFWASLLIIFGVSMLLGTLFGINIPIFRLLVGFFLIYLGIQLITGWPTGKDHVQPLYFGKRSISIDSASLQEGKATRYAIICGAADIDLSKLDIKKELRPVEIEVKTIFGGTEVALNKRVPTKIISGTSFGVTEFPDETTINFGNYTYQTQQEESPHIILRTNTAFGKLEIKAK